MKYLLIRPASGPGLKSERLFNMLYINEKIKIKDTA